jgi:hypothetical protein
VAARKAAPCVAPAPAFGDGLRMGPTLPFWTAFAATLLLLALALATGLRRRRRLHLVVAPLAMGMLALTIVLTEELVRSYAFAPDDLAFHLRFAKTAGVLALAVVATGIWLWRRPAARRWHRIAVWTFLAAAVVATGTGIWLFARGEPR